MDTSLIKRVKRGDSPEGQRDSMDSSIRPPARLSSIRRSTKGGRNRGRDSVGGGGGVCANGAVAAPLLNNYHSINGTNNVDSFPGPYGVVSGADSSAGSSSRKYKLLFVSNKRAQSITENSVGGGGGVVVSSGVGSSGPTSCPPQIDVIPLSEAVEAVGLNHLRSKSWRRYKRTNSGSIVLETCA